MLKVSAIIPAYNYGRYLGQAIESVLTQTYPAHEVIVVDDGSTDNTPDILARYGARIRAVHQRNQGVSAALNHGARFACGDLLAFLDADDVWLPAKLEKQVQRFRIEPKLGLVHCGYGDIDADGSELGTHLEGLEGMVANEMLLFRRPVILGGGSGCLVSKRIFWRVGGFDERIGISQDWDLYYRVACQAKVGFVPEVLLHYRLHGANRHSNIGRMKHDMLLAFEKVFNQANPELHRLRRRCYGNLHMMLAGSFFSVGEYRGFLEHAAKSLLLTPDNFSQFAEFPIRWLRRKLAVKPPSNRGPLEAVR